MKKEKGGMQEWEQRKGREAQKQKYCVYMNQFLSGDIGKQNKEPVQMIPDGHHLLSFVIKRISYCTSKLFHTHEGRLGSA